MSIQAGLDELPLNELPLASASGIGAYISAALAKILKKSFSEQLQLKLFGKKIFFKFG